MKAEIITIGTEILIGSILNTNSKYLSEKLVQLGVEVVRQVSLNDTSEDILEELNIAVKKVDLIFLCGGLGPTKDDLTKETVAKFVSQPLIYDEEEKNALVTSYEKSGRKMTLNNLKQVQLVNGSEKLKNYWGAALGECLHFKGKKLFLFPGPPKEFEPMVDYYLPKIVQDNQEILIQSLNVIGLGESVVEDRLRKLNLEREDLSINTFAHFTETEIKLIAKGNDKSELLFHMQNVIEQIRSSFRNYIYSDSNENIEEVIIRKLIEQDCTLSIAESLTGGLLTEKLTSVAGASKVLLSSIVAYSNEAKEKYLNVDKSILEKYGAISEQTALEMAKGLYHREKVDIAISTTGEAGPVPSETEVGTVYTCIYFGEKDYYLNRYFFQGNRDKIRNRTVSSVLSQLLYLINQRS